MGSAETAPLRLTLTLSGGASLGAYEAGAAAGLVVAWRHLDELDGIDASIDAVGGASAGSLVSLFVAHALCEGCDPVELMQEAWVERVSLKLLRSTSPDAPLSFDELREKLPELLEEPGDPNARQERGVALQVCLTGLRGLAYPIQGHRGDDPIRGVTYADWGRFELQPGGGAEQMLKPEGSSPLDFALASAASPGGFAPRLLDRSDDAEGYSSRGIEDFPEEGKLWYTDGGLVASQPIGRTFAAGRAMHGDDRGAHHLNLLIDPRSEVSTGDEPWSDTDEDLSWQAGTARSLAILSQQDLFEDLRKIEKDNSRLDWAHDLVEALGPQLKKGAAPALREFIERIRDDRSKMRADEPDRGSESDLEELDAAELLGLAVRETAGLEGKQPLALDVISPLILAEGEGDTPESILAGEFMGDFGGFLSRELRAHDFAVGFRSAIAWLDEGLRACDLDDGAVDDAIAAVSERKPDESAEDYGEAEVGDLSLRDRFQLVRLGAHSARVLGSSVIDWRSRIPDSVGRFLRRD